jgi:hypothetical protein
MNDGIVVLNESPVDVAGLRIVWFALGFFGMIG